MGELDEKLNSILNNPGAMEQIFALAQSLNGEGESPAAVPAQPPAVPTPPEGQESPSLGDLDPNLIRIGTRLFQEYQASGDKTTALLLALRPFLREERCARLDKAVQLARLARVIRTALGAMGHTGGEEDV